MYAQQLGNIGLCPVRPADMLSTVRVFSVLQPRWEHRLEVCVPDPA